MGSTEKGNAGAKGNTWGERVEECGEVRWRRDLERDCSKEFWEGKCGTNMESMETKRSTGRKKSTETKGSMGTKGSTQKKQEMQGKKVVQGEKDRGMWGSTLEEGP